MSFHNVTYYAFYNWGVWCDSSYHIVWSYAKDPLGAYKFGGTLLESGVTQGISLVAPGGTGFVSGDATTMMFMAYVNYPNPQCKNSQMNAIGTYRQLYTAGIDYIDGKPTVAT